MKNSGWWLQLIGMIVSIVSAVLAYDNGSSYWTTIIGAVLCLLGFLISPLDNIFRSLIGQFSFGSGDNVAGDKYEVNYLSEKDKVSYLELISRYSFGYVIFAIEKGGAKLIPGPMHLSKDYKINWDNAGVYKLTPEAIGMNLPTIIFKGGGAHNCGIEVHRILNIPQRSPLQFNDIVFDIYIELL